MKINKWNTNIGHSTKFGIKTGSTFFFMRQKQIPVGCLVSGYIKHRFLDKLRNFLQQFLFEIYYSNLQNEVQKKCYIRPIQDK